MRATLGALASFNADEKTILLQVTASRYIPPLQQAPASISRFAQ